MRKINIFGMAFLLLGSSLVWAESNPADKVEYIQAGNDKYYVKDVAVPKVSKAVDADPSDAVDVGGGTKGTKVNKPKTQAVVPAQRVPTNITPTNNPKEVQLQGGAKVVTPHNSSPKVAMPKGKPMPMVPSSKTTPVAEQKNTTPVQPQEQVKQTPVVEKKTQAQPAVEKKLTPQEVKKVAPVQEPKATTPAPAPVQEEKYARPKKVHLKDYEVEFFCDRNGKSVKCTEAEWNKEQEAKKAPKPAKATKPAKTTPSVKVSAPTGPTMTGNGVIIPAEPLKYGIKTKCVPLPGQTTCEEEKATSPNRLKGYKPTQGVEMPEATLPAGVKPTATPAKQETAKLDTVDTPKRKDFGANKEFVKGKNLLNGYGGVPTMYGNVEIPEASLPTEAEMDAQDARARAEMEAEQLLAEMEYNKAKAAAEQAKKQAQAAKNQAKQQQNAANLTCSYMGTYFRGNTCKYCVNHKPSNAMECNQCCQSFGRPLMQPASYRAFSSGGRPAGCLCRFGPTSGYNF